jgi:hypothetical protein
VGCKSWLLKNQCPPPDTPVPFFEGQKTVNIYFNRHLSDDDRRSEIYRGDIFVYSPSTRTLKLCALARSMIEEAFAPHDPRHIDEFLSMEQAAAVLHKLKPSFIHHPDCKQLLPDIIAEVGGDLQKTYFDVPRMRSAYPMHYLTSGIAYAFHPHRDTWYSAPMCQINWWLPIFDILPTNCMAFHPIYFSRPAENTSDMYIITKPGTDKVVSRQRSMCTLIHDRSQNFNKRSNNKIFELFVPLAV